MTCDKQYVMCSQSIYCNHICLIQRNYSATKTQRHKGNKNIAISNSYLKERNALQE